MNKPTNEPTIFSSISTKIIDGQVVGCDSLELERTRLDNLRCACAQKYHDMKNGDYVLSVSAAAVLREGFRLLRFTFRGNEKEDVEALLNTLERDAMLISIAVRRRCLDPTKTQRFISDFNRVFNLFYDLKQRSGLGVKLDEKKGEQRDGI